MALLMVERPTFAGWLMFGGFIGMASLSPRAGPRDDAWRWFQRLVWQPIAGAVGPIIDLLKLMRPKLQGPRFALLKVIPLLVLPVAGGLPSWASSPPPTRSSQTPCRASISAGPTSAGCSSGASSAASSWHVLRARHLRNPLPTPGARGDGRLPGVTLVSVVLSLVVFNALFAVQNGLDLTFLWSGQRLPEQFTLAEYVKAGVYPLITSALLTGLFVLVALRPGSEAAANKAVRTLVVVWVAQNLFVVASSAYRMVLYVESYSLTRLRILVLIWMVLVAIGLVTLLWRMLRDRSSSWLLNANATAALSAIALLAVVDIGEAAARWNVSHAREAGGRGVELDLCYLGKLGPSAAVAAAEFEHGLPESRLRSRAGAVRAGLLQQLEFSQANWRSWTWSGQRRLDRAREIAGGADAAARWPEDGAHCNAEKDEKFLRAQRARQQARAARAVATATGAASPVLAPPTPAIRATPTPAAPVASPSR